MAVNPTTILASRDLGDTEARLGCSTALVEQGTGSLDSLVHRVDVGQHHIAQSETLDTPLFNRDLTCLRLRIEAYEKYGIENQAALRQLPLGGAFYELIAEELRADQQTLQKGLCTARAELLQKHGVHHTGEACTIGLATMRTAAAPESIDALGYFQDAHERKIAQSEHNAASRPARTARRKPHTQRQMVS